MSARENSSLAGTVADQSFNLEITAQPARQKSLATPSVQASGNKITYCANLQWITHVSMQNTQQSKTERKSNCQGPITFNQEATSDESLPYNLKAEKSLKNSSL